MHILGFKNDSGQCQAHKSRARYAMLTPAKQSTTLRKTLMEKERLCPSSSNLKVSYAKVENVVKEPKIPMFIKYTMDSGSEENVRRASTIVPKRFTVSVPAGIFLILGTRLETVYLRHAPIKPPAPIKRSFPGSGKESIYLFSLPERVFITLLPINTPIRVRNRLALIFSRAGKKGMAKDWTTNVENVVNAPINPVPNASFPLGPINPMYSVSYIIMPSIKLPRTFTERVPRCASMSSQSKNREIAPRNPPAPIRRTLSMSSCLEGITFHFENHLRFRFF